MQVVLKQRQREQVIKFWQMTQDETLKQYFPFQNQSVDEALLLFEATQEPNAKSYGQTIYVNDVYVGDVWCYGLNDVDKSCFMSVVIFERQVWKKGVGTIALHHFIEKIQHRFELNKICAFTYADNIGSLTLLKKVGFIELERFVEENRESIYFELKLIK